MEKSTIINLIEQNKYRAEEESLTIEEAFDVLIEDIDAWFNEW